MSKPNFEGSYVASVTPLDKNDEIDVPGLSRLIEMHIEGGTNGIVFLGSAGESWMLNAEEKNLLVSKALEFANGRIPIVAGITRVSTEDAVGAAREMRDLGVDAIMAAAPPYVIPTQEAVYKHFAKICQSVDVPLALYNVPYRTGVNIEPEFIARLFEKDGLAAYKEAGKNATQIVEVMELTEKKLPILVCDAPAYGLIMPCLALGGNGTANISGNVAPKQIALLSRKWDSWQKVDEARRIFRLLLPLMKLVYQETNPVALKAVMHIVGLPSGSVRPPLLPINPEKLDNFRAMLEARGLLKLLMPTAN